MLARSSFIDTRTLGNDLSRLPSRVGFYV